MKYSMKRIGAVVSGLALAFACLAGAAGLAGCSGNSGQTGGDQAADTSGDASGTVQAIEAEDGQDGQAADAAPNNPPELEGLTFESSMDPQYATQFNVYYYSDGFKVLDVANDAQYLVVPEGAQAPANLPQGMVVLQQPLSNVYVAATAAPALIDAIGGLDAVSMSGTDADGWSVDAMREAIKAGTITYVGKYSAPDYETLVDKGCDMALESTMILHSPDVKEALEKLGIPVMVEHSSYEADPMGRVEWARFYGALLNREAEAEAFFAEQAKLVEDLGSFENTGKTVAFFSVNSNGQVVVRRPGDFITRSIDIAGGVYPFAYLDDSGKLSTMKISMEEFYATAVDADYLVYNGTIEAPLTSIDDLLDKNQTFAEYKAVKEGHVYTTDKDMYQETDKLAELINDFHILVTDGDPASLVFLKNVE